MITLGLALNTENMAPSQYAGLNFNSLCEFNGVILGANETGIMELEGDTDNGTDIYAFFQIPSTDLGMHNQKKIRSLILSGDQYGNFIITSIFDNEEDTEYVAALTGTIRQNSIKIDMNSDVAGRFVGLLIENIAGADFSIDAIDALVIPVIAEPSITNILGKGKVDFPLFSNGATIAD